MGRKKVFKPVYAQDVDEIFHIMENEELNLKLTFARIADNAVKARRIRLEGRKSFIVGLKSAYYRELKRRERQYGHHGNCKLSNFEEQCLVGFAAAWAEAGEKVSHKHICDIARVFRPDLTFGEEWCAPSWL